MNNRSIEYVDKILGTNIAAEMQAQQPATQKQPEQNKQSEKEMLREQLEILKLRKQILEVNKNTNQEQKIRTQTITPPVPKIYGQPPVQPSIIPTQTNNIGELYDPSVHIYKKQAAIEVIKQVDKSNKLAYVSIAGMFITAITSVLSSFGGAAVAGVFTIGVAFVLYRDTKYKNYLNSTYQIAPQKKGF